MNTHESNQQDYNNTLLQNPELLFAGELSDDHTSPVDSPEDTVLEPVLTKNQLRVLRCILCMDSGSKGPLVGISKDLEMCTGFSQSQRKRAQHALVRKQLITVETNQDPTGRPQIRGRPIRYALTENGRKYGSELPKKACPINRANYSPSPNPYLQATSFQKSLLDCIRCITAQGRQPSKHLINLCLPNHSTASIQEVLRRLVKEGALDTTQKSTGILLTNGRAGASYGASSLSEDFMQPTKLEGCTILQKEAQHILANHSDDHMRILSCLACQYRSVESGTREDIAMPAVVHCTGLSPQRISSRTSTYVREGILRRDMPKSLAQTFTPSELGEMLLDACVEANMEVDACRQPTDSKAIKEARLKLENEILGCVSCLESQQTNHGLPGGVTLDVVSRCRGIATETAAKITARLVQRNALVQEMDKTVALFCTPGTDLSQREDCSYKIDPPFILQSIVTSLDRHGLSNELLSAHEETRLSAIIQDSTDPNAQNAAIHEMFAKNIRLAFYLAEHYKPPIPAWQLEHSDLIQVGLTTLYKCIKMFKSDYSMKFSAYYGKAFRYEADKEISRQVNVSTYLVTAARQISRFVARLAAQKGDLTDLTQHELLSFIQSQPDANKIKRVSLSTAIEIYFLHSRRELSLSQSIGDHDDITLDSTIGVQQDMESDMRLSIENLFSALPTDDIDKTIIEDIMLNSYQPRDIMQQHNISAGELKQRHNKILAILSHPSFEFLPTISEAYSWQKNALCKDDSKFKERVLSSSSGSTPKHHQNTCSVCPVKSKCEDLYEKLDIQTTQGVWAGNEKRR